MSEGKIHRMTESELARLQREHSEAQADREGAEEALRGLGLEPTGALLPGQPSVTPTEAQIAALADLRAAGERVEQTREALAAHLRAQAGDAHR